MSLSHTRQSLLSPPQPHPPELKRLPHPLIGAALSRGFLQPDSGTITVTSETTYFSENVALNPELSSLESLLTRVKLPAESMSRRLAFADQDAAQLAERYLKAS
jgi:hypothetical protein